MPECLRDIKCNSPRFSTCIQGVVKTFTVNSQNVSTKTILKVRGKASDVKIFSQTSINKILIDLTNNWKKACRTILTWIRSLSVIFKNWLNR